MPHIFYGFIQGLAALYSGGDNCDSYPFYDAFYKISKAVSTRPFEYHSIYGAYEIEHKQTAAAIIEVQFGGNFIANMSFSEDGLHLTYPSKIQRRLTQQDYITVAEQTYPKIIEDRMFEKMKAWKNRKKLFHLLRKN